MQRLNGKVAIITGGANGIGAATARRLASEGAQVVIADIDLDKGRQVAKEIGDMASAVHMDGGDETSVRQAIDQTAEKFGRLDILHNNHALLEGALHDDGTAITTSYEVWDRAMRINLRGYFSGCKYALPHMIRNKSGSIINMSSDSALASDIFHIAYGVSKAGVLALTRAVAVQHGMDGIRCNAICPGLIVTPNVRVIAAELIEVVNKHVIAPKEGEPEDIAALVAFFAADESKFISGQVWSVDGGLIAHLPQNNDLRDYLDRQAHKG